MEELEILKKEYNELMDKLSENRDRQREINVDTFCKKYDLTLGDSISFMYGETHIEGVLIDFYFGGGNTTFIFLEIAPFKKNGQPSKTFKKYWRDSVKSLKRII